MAPPAWVHQLLLLLLLLLLLALVFCVLCMCVCVDLLAGCCSYMTRDPCNSVAGRLGKRSLKGNLKI